MEASPRFIVLIVLFFFIFLSPDPATIHRLGNNVDGRLADLRHADFNVIVNSTYGDLETIGLNLTGFRADDGYQWGILPKVKDIVRAQRFRDHSNNEESMYRRLNSEIRGQFVRRPIRLDPNLSINLTELDPSGNYFANDFERNVTDPFGELTITLDESRASLLTKEIEASIAIHTKSSPGTGYEANLRGVHFNDGSVILTTISRKFNAVPVLPHFTLDEQEYNSSRAVINRTLTRVWEHASLDDGPLISVPNCELIVWLQQKPLHVPAKYVAQIEQELEAPDGAPIGSPEPIAFSAVVFSPDCGYVLEADTVYGPKSEAYWGLVQRLLIAFIGIVALEITLLKRQMEKCATPSTRARISYHSIGIAAFGDGLILFAMIGLLTIEGEAFLLLAAAGFLCCMHVAFFEVKFIFDIWNVQVGEPAQAQRERERRVAATATTTTTNAEGLPLPATAPTQGQTPQIQADQAESPRSSFASLYSRFYFILINLMFFSLWAMTWPERLRTIYFNVLAFCYLSLWIPQIHRNIIRNCRKALNWEYVVGTSILRAIPVLYWYLDNKNLLAAKANPSTAFALVCWLCFQIAMLFSQQYLGPRLLVKDSWCPPAYDYHPLLSDDLESRGMPIGEVASASEGKDKNNKTRKVFDCAICMNEIDVPVISKDESTGRSWLEQRNYMVTPCRHIFHTDCLEGWMNLRLVCPVCREGLPPL